MRKIHRFLRKSIPFIVFFGLPCIAPDLRGHTFDCVVLAVSWVVSIFLYITIEKLYSELKQAKQSLFETERAHYTEEKRLDIAMDLLTDEQLLQFCQKDIRGHAPIKYEYFNPHSEDGKYEWVDYD